MLDAAGADALARSLLLGTSRQPLPVERVFGGALAPDDPKAALKALALLAQQKRFRRPAPVAAPAAKLPFADGRVRLAEQARPLLLLLLSDKGGTAADTVALAIADAMARRHVTVHPFDLPRLRQFVKAHGGQLGAAALAWIDRRLGASAGAFFDGIDETTGRWRLPRRSRPSSTACARTNLRARANWSSARSATRPRRSACACWTRWRKISAPTTGLSSTARRATAPPRCASRRRRCWRGSPARRRPPGGFKTP
jgi:hypothetical protein